MTIFALGRHLLFRELTAGHWIVIGAVIAIILLLRFWTPLVQRLERWWRSR
jgi:antibiotic biosynthesis monooxygenase (ABM) superfamily enzyme